MLRLGIVQTVISELINNFEYLHWDTIIRYCNLYHLNNAEKLEVYEAVAFKINYQTK